MKQDFSLDRSSPQSFMTALKIIAETQNYSSLNSLCTSESSDLVQSVCGIGELSENLQESFSQTYSTLMINGLVKEKGDLAFVPVVGIDEMGQSRECIFLLKNKQSVWYWQDVLFENGLDSSDWDEF